MDNSFNSKIVACIPAYNEGKYIGAVVKAAKQWASDVIVYDDGSTDDTRAVSEAEGATVLTNPRNRGYGFAIRFLLDHARKSDGDIIVTLDADGQHDASQIPRLIEPIVKGEVHVVIGSRFINNSDTVKVPLYRSVGIKTITRLVQLASYTNLTDAQSGFRAYSRLALADLDLFEDGMAISTEILIQAKQKGLKISEVPVTVDYKVEDSSTHNPIRHGVEVASSVLKFISLRHPLLFYGLPGLILLIASAYYAYDAMELYASTKYISTNTIIVGMGCAIIGVVLLATGILIWTIVALLRGKLKDSRTTI